MNREHLRKLGKTIFGGGKNGILIILILLFVFASTFVDGFFSQTNLTNVLRQITVVTILSLGATFVIILGHINVAYGSEIALMGCVACSVMVATGNLFFAILSGLAMGFVVGFISGFIITTFKIPAFIMTLAVTTVARGAVLLYTKASPITGLKPEFTFIGQGYIGFLPVSVLILIVLFFITYQILNKTVFGRYLYAVGGNENAAVASGIKTSNVVIRAFIFDGIMTAIAGIIFMSRINSGQPAGGVGYEFDAITAVVVGGTSLSGGSGTIVGTIIGSVIVGIINNVLNLQNVNAYWQQITKGLIILLAVIIDVVNKRTISVRRS
ncbi:MAG: ABC transporter permease [Syntrophomonadaceae bacterium]|jgi:inositol transport system permease protein|nr:ABC transporter permease [Syntrophomonadaceae bacterium]